MLSLKMTVIDLKSPVGFSPSKPRKGLAYEYWQNYFRSSDGSSATPGISKMRPALWRQLQSKIGSFSCLDQFLVMAFAQLSYRESLRDIEACLWAMRNKLYHMGIRGGVSRNNLAHANEIRDWRIWADFAQVLIHTARHLYVDDPFGIELDQTVYAFDSTTIDLCLALFPWARFRKRKAAIKLHTLLDLRGSIPTFIQITEGKVHDVNALDELIPEPGSFYVMDRAYLDFERLYLFH